MGFKATHRIVPLNAPPVLVMLRRRGLGEDVLSCLFPYPAFTEAEWNGSDIFDYDYELHSDNTWTFRGRPFAGTVELLKLPIDYPKPDTQSAPRKPAMNLSKPTNSLQSNIMHASVGNMPDPFVGMGVTILMWSDRRVGTVQQVHDPRHVEFTEDETAAAPSAQGMGHQDWIHTQRPDWKRVHAMRHTDDRWYVVIPGKKPGTWKLPPKAHRQPLALGRKDYYHDWSF